MNRSTTTDHAHPTSTLDPAVRSRLIAIAAQLEVTAMQNKLMHLHALAQELKNIADTTTKD